MVFDDEYRDMVEGAGVKTISSEDFVAAARTAEPVAEFADPEDVAIVLFTSGTTSRPKAVELSHNNLTSYVMGTVEFASAQPDDAVLICVPPYHIAGVSAALSNLYAGRKMVYLTHFDATGVDPAGQRRGGDQRHCRPDHARSDRQRAGDGIRRRCRPCARWPTAARKSLCPLCARRSTCCPTSAS